MGLALYLLAGARVQLSALRLVETSCCLAPHNFSATEHSASPVLLRGTACCPTFELHQHYQLLKTVSRLICFCSLTLYSLIWAAYFLYGALVVTLRTCYCALQIVVLLLLLLTNYLFTMQNKEDTAEEVGQRSSSINAVRSSQKSVNWENFASRQSQFVRLCNYLALAAYWELFLTMTCIYLCALFILLFLVVVAMSVYYLVIAPGLSVAAWITGTEEEVGQRSSSINAVRSG